MSRALGGEIVYTWEKEEIDDPAYLKHVNSARSFSGCFWVLSFSFLTALPRSSLRIQNGSFPISSFATCTSCFLAAYRAQLRSLHDTEHCSYPNSAGHCLSACHMPSYPGHAHEEIGATQKSLL